MTDPQIALAIPLDQQYERFTTRPPGYDTGQCRGCDAPILWATKVDAATGRVLKSPRTGKAQKVPLDLASGNPHGQFRLVGDGKAMTIAPGELVEARDRWTNHFVSCPKRDQFRRGGRR